MAGQSKQSSFTHDLASSLMYAPMEGNTGIATSCSFMHTHQHAPDSETSLMPVFFSFTCFPPSVLHNNNWASGSKHPGPSESDVYSDVIQEAQSNDLLHTARLLMRLDTPLHDNNARGTKYAVYYASVVTHTMFENKKKAALTLFWN